MQLFIDICFTLMMIQVVLLLLSTDVDLIRRLILSMNRRVGIFTLVTFTVADIVMVIYFITSILASHF